MYPSQKGKVSGSRQELDNVPCVAYPLACPLRRLRYPRNYKLNVPRSSSLCILLNSLPHNPLIKMFPKFFNFEFFSSLKATEQFYTLLMFTSVSDLFTPPPEEAHSSIHCLCIVYDADWASDQVGRLWRRKLLCFLSKI